MPCSLDSLRAHKTRCQAGNGFLTLIGSEGEGSSLRRGALVRDPLLDIWYWPIDCCLSPDKVTVVESPLTSSANEGIAPNLVFSG